MYTAPPGLAYLNASLLHAGDNVQVRLKASPFGRQSHGHDPHNLILVNAYGEGLLGSPASSQED